MWKWAMKFKIGEKWAISVPAMRILEEYQDGGSTPNVRAIIHPLLQAVKDVPLVHAYILSVFAVNDLPVSEERLKKIIDILTKKWFKSIVAPGEMVGTIAAQSVGEPTTQVRMMYIAL